MKDRIVYLIGLCWLLFAFISQLTVNAGYLAQKDWTPSLQGLPDELPKDWITTKEQLRNWITNYNRITIANIVAVSSLTLFGLVCTTFRTSASYLCDLWTVSLGCPTWTTGDWLWNS
jgi:hypothetical protein